MRLLLAAVVLMAGKPLWAEDPHYAVFGLMEKHDFAVRFIPEHQDFALGYSKDDSKDLTLATNSESIAGVGLRVGNFKFMFGEPSGIEAKKGISTSKGRTLSGHYFHGSHYFYLQSSKISGFYQLFPVEFSTDGTPTFRRHQDLKIESQQMRYSYNFEPKNYSLRTKHIQTEVETEQDGATFIIELRISKDRLSGNGANIVPDSLQSDLMPDHDIAGFELIQVSPLAGIGYMMRERSLYASADIQAGGGYQLVEIFESQGSRATNNFGVACAIEAAVGLVLANVYISGLIHLESFQIPLKSHYIEELKSFARLEVGARF